MKKKLIKGGLIVNENKILKKDILIHGERIKEISNEISNLKEKHELINANGKYIIPGLIDDQVHFRDPGLTHKGDILSESKAAIAGGITSYIEMPNTIPQTITLENLDKKFDIASEKSWANYSFMFGGTNDNFEVIKKLDKNNVAGLKLFLGSSTGNMLIDNHETLRKIFLNTDLLISAHCEDESTIKKNLSKYMNTYNKDIPFKFHPNIRSSEACYISSSNAIKLAQETKARLHVFHISTSIEVDLFNNDVPLSEKKITSEACIHHLWFTDSDYEKLGSKIKWNPAIKSKKDQDAIWQGINNNKIDIIATDHAPHLLTEKNQNYLLSPSGGPLVQHGLLALLTCHKKGKITLEKIVEKTCHNPAILFEIKERGYLRENYFADLVILDLNNSTIVSKKNLLYKCGWSPFEGTIFEAKVDSTWVNGECAYRNGLLVKRPNVKKLQFNR